MHAGLRVNAVCYDLAPTAEGGFDGKSWMQDAKPALRAKNSLMNLPYCVDGDMVVSQTNSVMSYIGRRTKLWGENDAEVSQCEQLLCEIMDIRNQMIPLVYGPDGGSAEKCAEKLVAVADPKRGSFAKLDEWLAAQPDPAFFVGGRPTAPDFHAFEMCDQFRHMATYHSLADPLANYPKLDAFHKAFAARESACYCCCCCLSVDSALLLQADR
jgi:hypothetical protein